MKTNRIFIFGLFLLLGCKESVAPIQASYKVEGDQIVVPNNSPFLKHLEVKKTTQTPLGDVVFKTVGQIIALANSSGVLSNSEISWVELDPDLTILIGLHLGAFAKSPLGTAFGVTSVPDEYSKQIRPGQSVEIARYGLKKTEVTAFVVKIEPRKEDHGSSYATFEIRQGQDWYPGTNCEVRFPLLHVQAVGVPTTAILHEGLNEFVLKETSLGHYRLTPVFIVDETPDSAHVMGLSFGDSIVASGAILLKPELHNFVHGRKELHHELK